MSSCCCPHDDDNKSQQQELPIVVVGAGLVGCMTALLLAQQGHKLVLIEAREDFRIVESQDGEGGRLANSIKRSINLALSFRGISALKKAGLFERIQDKLIPMKGRMIHSVKGDITFQPYGVGDQAIYSISRADLNTLLLNEVDKFDSVKTMFGKKVVDVTSDARIVVENSNKTQETIQAKFIIGCDGAYSAVRRCLQRLTRMNYSQQYISNGYKELTIEAKDGDFALPQWQGLHIWPRKKFMLIALPNPDKSFTCTLFAPFDGEDGMETLTTDEQITKYFETNFPDVIPHMPDFVQQFKTSPNSNLVTVRASPWNYKDKVFMIGDAAHAVVPFYGQGMNSGFEDALEFIEMFEKNSFDHSKTIPEFCQAREPAGHAIMELSLENWYEMQAATASQWFLFKKKVEGVLHWMMPQTWVPKYTMVAFTRTPYHVAVKRAHKQEKLLDVTLKIAGVASAIGLVAGLYANRDKVSQYMPNINALKK